MSRAVQQVDEDLWFAGILLGDSAELHLLRCAPWPLSPLKPVKLSSFRSDHADTGKLGQTIEGWTPARPVTKLGDLSLARGSAGAAR